MLYIVVTESWTQCSLNYIVFDRDGDQVCSGERLCVFDGPMQALRSQGDTGHILINSASPPQLHG